MTISWNREHPASELHRMLMASYAQEDFTIGENPCYDVATYINTEATYTHVLYDNQFIPISSDTYITSGVAESPQRKSSNTRW